MDRERVRNGEKGVYPFPHFLANPLPRGDCAIYRVESRNGGVTRREILRVKVLVGMELAILPVIAEFIPANSGRGGGRDAGLLGRRLGKPAPSRPPKSASCSRRFCATHDCLGFPGKAVSQVPPVSVLPPNPKAPIPLSTALNGLCHPPRHACSGGTAFDCRGGGFPGCRSQARGATASRTTSMSRCTMRISNQQSRRSMSTPDTRLKTASDPSRSRERRSRTPLTTCSAPSRISKKGQRASSSSRARTEMRLTERSPRCSVGCSPARLRGEHSPDQAPRNAGPRQPQSARRNSCRVAPSRGPLPKGERWSRVR